MLIGGEDIAGLSAKEIARRAAVVPQTPVLPVGFLSREIVVMGRTPYLGFLEQESAVDYQKADAALASLGAEAVAYRRVEELSGGERQNVVLARALAQETRPIKRWSSSANNSTTLPKAVAPSPRPSEPLPARSTTAARYTDK